MTTTIADFLKISAAVIAVALALFFGYSVAGYATDTFSSAFAGEPECSGPCESTDWGPIWFWDGGIVGRSLQADGGGGGGGGFGPYCTLTLTEGYVIPHTYPTQKTYTLTWAAPAATSFSISNGIGSVTPPTGGTYSFTSATAQGTYVGTAVTPRGTVTCQTAILPPPPNPPYCSIIATPSTVTSGGASDIVWNTTSGTSFSINNGVGALTPVGGGTVTVHPAVTTTYTGTVIGTGGTAQCTTTVTVTPPQECKLEITKVANKTTIAEGESVEYTITVKNAGGAVCSGSGVKIQDILDPRLNYQSETHSSNLSASYNGEPVYKVSNRTVSFNGWDLDPQESGWIKLVVTGGTPTACSEVVPNKARVTSYEYNNFMTWVESPVSNVTLTKDCTPPPPTECKLEITKVANKTTVAPNENVTYTIVVKNTGTKKCTGSGVKIEDTLDARFTYLSETHTSNLDGGYGTDPVYKLSDRTLRYNGWDLDPNESGTIYVTVKAGTPNTCSEIVPNKARVTSYEYNNFGTWVESQVANVTLAKDCTPPPTECKLEITKVADKTTVTAGGTIEYTINVKNTGTKVCTGSGVKIQDVLDPRLNYQSETHSYNIVAGYGTDPVYKSSDRTLRFNAWDLDPAETGWIKVVVTAATPTTCSEVVPNTAKITAIEYNNFMTWVESAVSNVTVTKYCHTPAPYCTLSIDPSSVTSGGPATLAWNSTNVTSVTIDQGVGSVALSGTKVVNPTANTTYTGTFTGPGGTVTCQATVTIPTGPAPQCTLTASASKIRSGQSVFVTWTSQNVTSGNITTIGNASPVSGGSVEVFPSDSTTYTGTFTGSYGTVTCSVPVTVEKGGGGCSGNCGGGLNQPNVVMLQKPPEAPLAFVTLDQIPYTGFEAGKALTLAFWISVGLLAAAITYFAMGQNALQMVLGAAPSPWNNNAYAGLDEDVRDTTPHEVPNTLSETRRDSAAYSASVAAAPVYQYAPSAPVAQRPVVDGIPDLTDVIESRAHGAGVLMSPEAVQLALDLASDRGEVLRVFGEILNEAVKVLPREDGWVMLTSERFEDLSGAVTMPVTRATPTSTPSVEAILNSVMPPAAPTAQAVAQPNVEMPMTNADDQSVVMSLARSILAGNRDQAFATLRNLEVSGAKAGSVMTVIAGAYDQLYRARRHGLTTDLSGEALAVTDESLAKMTETFIHSMDQAYANPFMSLKLAIAQAFEVRG